LPKSTDNFRYRDRITSAKAGRNVSTIIHYMIDCLMLRRIVRIAKLWWELPVGWEEVRPPVHCANPPLIFFPFCWGVNRNLPVSPFYSFLHTVVVHCSCLAFRTDSAMFVFRTLVKFTFSVLSLSRVSQCNMINYN